MNTYLEQNVASGSRNTKKKKYRHVESRNSKKAPYPSRGAWVAQLVRCWTLDFSSGMIAGW